MFNLDPPPQAAVQQLAAKADIYEDEAMRYLRCEQLREAIAEKLTVQDYNNLLLALIDLNDPFKSNGVY